MIALECSACACTDVVGPFEMDGYVRGEYVASGAWWIVCRACGVTTLSHEQTEMFAVPANVPTPARAARLNQPDLFAVTS